MALKKISMVCSWVDCYGEWEFETDQDHHRLLADGLVSQKRELLFVVAKFEVLTHTRNTRKVFLTLSTNLVVKKPLPFLSSLSDFITRK